MARRPPVGACNRGGRFKPLTDSAIHAMSREELLAAISDAETELARREEQRSTHRGGCGVAGRRGSTRAKRCGRSGPGSPKGGYEHLSSDDMDHFAASSVGRHSSAERPEDTQQSLDQDYRGGGCSSEPEAAAQAGAHIQPQATSAVQVSPHQTSHEEIATPAGRSLGCCVRVPPGQEKGHDKSPDQATERSVEPSTPTTPAGRKDWLRAHPDWAITDGELAEGLKYVSGLPGQEACAAWLTSAKFDASQEQLQTIQEGSQGLDDLMAMMAEYEELADDGDEEELADSDLVVFMQEELELEDEERQRQLIERLGAVTAYYDKVTAECAMHKLFMEGALSQVLEELRKLSEAQDVSMAHSRCDGGDTLLNKLLKRSDLTVEVVQEAAKLPTVYWQTPCRDITPLIDLCCNEHIKNDAEFATMLQAVKIEHPQCFRYVSKEGWGPLTYICVSKLVSVDALQLAIDAGHTVQERGDGGLVTTNTEFAESGSSIKQRLWTNDEFTAKEMRQFCELYTVPRHSHPDDHDIWDPDFLTKCWLDPKLGTPLRWVLTLRAVDLRDTNQDGVDKVDLAAEQSVKAGLLTTNKLEFAPDVRLLNGLFRTRFPERFAKLCTLEELWDGTFPQNPLSCAIQNRNRELAGALVKSLIKQQAVSRVRDMQRNIEQLFNYKGGELAPLAYRLLEDGALIGLDPARFMTSHIKAPMALRLGQKCCYSQDKLHPSDSVEMFVNKIIIESVPDEYYPQIAGQKFLNLKGKGRWDKDCILGKPVSVEDGQHRGKKGVCVGAAVQDGKMALSIRWDKSEEDVRDDGNGTEKVVIAGGDNQATASAVAPAGEQKVCKVAYNEHSNFWANFLRKATKECNTDQASHVELEPVEPVALVINGAAKSGGDGLLQILVRCGTLKVFECEVVRLLIDWKWENFGKAKFRADACRHVALLVAWTWLTTRAAGDSRHMFVHLPAEYAIIAWLLCLVNATLLRRLENHLHIWGHSVAKPHNHGDFSKDDDQTGLFHSSDENHEVCKTGRRVAKRCLSTSRALECNPAHPDWEHAMPSESMLKSLSVRMLKQQQKTTKSGTDGARAKHQPSGCLHKCAWWCIVLPLHYIAGGLLRVLPATLAFIMLGGTCKLPPLSYPQCEGNWVDTSFWSTPVVEAAAMTLLLVLLNYFVWSLLDPVLDLLWHLPKELYQYCSNGGTSSLTRTSSRGGSSGCGCSSSPAAHSCSPDRSHGSERSRAFDLAWSRIHLAWDGWRLIDVLSYVPAILITVNILTAGTNRAWVTQLATPTTSLMWFRFVHCLSGLSGTSKFVIIFVKMLESVVVIAAVLLILVFGNALSLQMSFPHENMSNPESDGSLRSWMDSRGDHQIIDENFGSLAASLFTSFNMLLQAFDSSLLQNAYDPWLAKVCYAFYAFMAHIVVLNMMIAQMSDDYATIIKQAAAYEYKQRAKLIVLYEVEDAGLSTELRLDSKKETATPEDGNDAKNPKKGFHFLHFFKKQSAYQDCVDEIETSWNKRSQRQLYQVQDTVTQVQETVTALNGQIVELSRRVEQSLAAKPDALNPGLNSPHEMKPADHR